MSQESAFLGAGVIFQSENCINGIMTSATIWAVAALGMGIAGAQYWIVLISAIIVLSALLILTRLEKWIDFENQSRTYKIVSSYQPKLMQKYEQIFKNCNLHFKTLKKTKQSENITGSWLVNGKEKNHKKLVEEILHDSSIKKFEF